MEWEPEEQAWLSYIKMEMRYKEVERARLVYERFIQVHPEPKNWVRYAKFEENNGYPANARNVFERSTEFFGEEHMDEKLYIAFAKFEEGCREYERARTIFKYALEHIPKEEGKELFKVYTQFEKKYGDRAGIEDVVISKRKLQYEEAIEENPMNYESWFDYIRLMEDEGSLEMTREVYERAIANVPLSNEKKFWRRYIYLWIYYALYEELVAKDYERTRQVYKACLDIVPHKEFTFSKLWIMYAKFEVRQKNLSAARKALGAAIGKCPKPKTFKGYIELELQLREFDRCRKLYEKFLEHCVSNCQTWIKYAELETILGDIGRARAIYELAVNQPVMDMPEVLWKSYVDFESELEEFEKVRDLYERLLERTQHVKVWLSVAKFEDSLEGEDKVVRARKVYERADKCLRNCENNEERSMFLEAWKNFESEQGDEEHLDIVKKKLPRRVKKKRKVYREDGSDRGWEEYWDYVFPDDEASAPNLKLLQLARMWKEKQDDEDDDDEDDDEEGDDEDDEEDDDEGKGDSENEGKTNSTPPASHSE